MEDLQSREPEVKKKSGRGGPRPGSGRPKGKLEPQTIERKEALKQFRDRVVKNTDRLFNSQMTLAQGVSYLFRIDTDSEGKRSKPELVTDADEIQGYLDGDYTEDKATYYFITTERPDNKAIDSMLDRTYGRAEAKMDITSNGETITPRIVSEIKPRAAGAEAQATEGN